MAISGGKKTPLKISTGINLCVAIFTNKYFTLFRRIAQAVISLTVIINEQLKKTGCDVP